MLGQSLYVHDTVQILTNPDKSDKSDKSKCWDSLFMFMIQFQILTNPDKNNNKKKIYVQKYQNTKDTIIKIQKIQLSKS